jgi:tRNA (mo5U34)-methyltransferase
MDLQEKIAQYFWWHTIDLGNGVVTPGFKTADLMRIEADALFSPVDLHNKTFLDVGAWNGGFSVEAARRGATRIAALDHYTWKTWRGRETIDLVAQVTNNHIEAIEIDLDMPGLSLKHLGKFDVVLFSGVFYHLIDPIAATREVAALAREVLIVETHVEIIPGDRPAMVFYPGAELADDPTNWWGPNIACVCALLKQCGFARVDVAEGSDDTRKVFHAYRE